MRRWFVCLIGFLWWISVQSLARGYSDLVLPEVDFAATAVHEAGAIRTEETIHYSKGRLRIDRGKGFASTILDFTTQTQCLLMANHTYLITPMDSELLRRYVARSPGISGARKLGKGLILGQETTKYAFGDEGQLGAAGFFWLTPTGMLMRKEYDEGVYGHDLHHVEFLTHITFQDQPESLFSIPPGYQMAR